MTKWFSVKTDIQKAYQPIKSLNIANEDKSVIVLALQEFSRNTRSDL